MATTTLPRRRGVNRWMIAGVIAIGLAIGSALLLNAAPRPQAAQVATTPVVRGSIVAQVAGSGSITAARELDLSFQTAGTVVEVLVQEGARVEAGQPLARLDTRELELQVAQSAASLESAQAQLAQAEEGSATPEELAAAAASVANAQANLTKVRTGNVTAADIASAEAALRSAQAQLDDLLAGPDPDDVVGAQSRVDQARAALEADRTRLSVTKTSAESQAQQAANELRNRQDEYSRIYWDNRQRESLPGDLPQAQIDEEAAALRAVRDAEQSLAQAQLSYEQARQDEISGLQQAEADLADAEASLRIAQKGAGQSDIAQARATVDQRRADLQNLRQGGTAADVAAAAATVDQQQANLAQLTAPASGGELRVQRASVTQAEQSLEQSRLQLSYATLTAPFSGVIGSVAIVPGSVVGSGSAVATLIDRSALHVAMRLNETDVAQVQRGQAVQISIDALSGWTSAGEVSSIAPAGSETNGVVTYDVRVSFAGDDAQVLIGMTADLAIVVAEKQDALLIPTAALLPSGAGQVVQMPDGQGGVREVAVATGLTDGQQIEILSGLSVGDQIVTLPSSGQERQQAGPFGN